MVDVIIFIGIGYFGFGIWVSYALFAHGYGGKHQDEKMLATVFFWPLIFAGAIIVLCFMAIFSAFKGLYYIVRDAIKEEENET